MMKKTKLQAWKSAALRLEQAGKRDSNFEVELLLRSALGEDRARFLASLHDELPAAAEAQLDAWVEARLQNVPVQYLLGRQEFMGLDFLVSPAVLVPRPDTEVLVEQACEFLQGLRGEVAEVRLADLATGSGAIALSLAHYAPWAKVWATDISPDALEVAEANRQRLGLAERVTLLQGSWAEPLKAADLRVHCLTSNPPYIRSADIFELDPEVRQEPMLALDGGTDGLDCYRALVPQASELLLPGGMIFLEIGQGQHEAVAALLESDGFADVGFTRDLAGIIRVVSARRLSS